MDSLAYGYCHLPLLSMRATGSHRSELVNQLLHNELYSCIEQETEWYKIRSWHDAYEGWIPKEQFYSCSEIDFKARQVFYKAPVQNAFISTPNGFRYLGSPQEKLPTQKLQLADLIPLGDQFLNSPYLWGGRSVSGIDCSGLIQVLFRSIGLQLPRDAYQQAEVGLVIPFEEHKLGDLAFFHNTAGKITHVGLVIGPNKILHASAWVRIDELKDSGIWHKSTKTHSLTKITRPPTP
jgi:gamma-D-glutamyl-L-lysine dipeptidyl-peptidase